jgi:pimeloyl-ACP methyl ester carboxylesterase
LAVEKPGVVPFDPSGHRGDAMNCPPGFLEEHTLDRWGVALDAAVEAVRARSNRTATRTVVVGHSEGAAAAARLARVNRHVTHVALLSPSGMGQLHDFLIWAKRRQSSQGQEAIDRAIQAVHAEVARIRSKPDSIVDFAWGHPYRRWPSFLEGTILDDIALAGPGLRVFVAFGTHDASIPLESHREFVPKISDLVRFTTIEIRDGADHALNTPGQASPSGMTDVFVNILSWLRQG